jgi:hypothetical protein
MTIQDCKELVFGGHLLRHSRQLDNSNILSNGFLVSKQTLAPFILRFANTKFRSSRFSEVVEPDHILQKVYE